MSIFYRFSALMLNTAASYGVELMSLYCSQLLSKDPPVMVIVFYAFVQQNNRYLSIFNALILPTVTSYFAWQRYGLREDRMS